MHFKNINAKVAAPSFLSMRSPLSGYNVDKDTPQLEVATKEPLQHS